VDEKKTHHVVTFPVQFSMRVALPKRDYQIEQAPALPHGRLAVATLRILHADTRSLPS
jgi:hypothetical protein